MSPPSGPFASLFPKYICACALRGTGQRGHGEAIRGLAMQALPYGPSARCPNIPKRTETQPTRKPCFPARACCRQGWTSCRGWRRWHRRPGHRVDTKDLRDGSPNRTTRTKERNSTHLSEISPTLMMRPGIGIPISHLF